MPAAKPSQNDHADAQVAQPPPAPPGGGRRLRTEIVLLTLTLVLAAWAIGPVLLLIFAGLLFAVALDAPAQLLARQTRLSRGWALLAVITTIALVIVAGASAITPQFVSQFEQLWDQLDALVARGQELLEAAPFDIGGGDEAPSLGGIAGQVATATYTVLGALASVGLVVVIGVFAAANPPLYTDGLVKLVPQRRRARARLTLRRLGRALRWWLVGQAVSMLTLGVVSAIGLYLFGLELWLGLAVLIGLLTFVPFLGPIAAGIPVVLIAFGDGYQTGIGVLVFLIVLQNVEGNFLTPMVQQRAVMLPPVLLIAMQILLGTLFGVAGLIMAAPLAVVAMVLVQTLYVEGVLGDDSAQSVTQAG